MFLSWLRKSAWARPTVRKANRSKAVPRPRPCWPRVEALEDRLCLSALPAAPALAPADAATQARVSQAYGQLPLSFEANQGQADCQVNFLSHGSGYSLFLTPTQAMLDLNQGSGVSGQASADNVLTMQLVGSNPAAQAVGRLQLPGVSNYLVGNDTAQWHTNIPNYAKVEYQNVYPGVNVVYYGNNQHQLEYDFVLAPGANPQSIQLSFQGAQGMHLDAQGDLVLHTSAGDVAEQAPVLYQDSNGVRQNVPGQYVLEGNGQVGIAVGAYDTTRPLVIDPTYSLVYSTYLGGSYGNTHGFGIAVDSAGNAYVTGDAWSRTFPTTRGVLHTKGGGGTDAFITKFNAAGTALVYSTYLGGSGNDFGRSIAVDSSGNAYVAGYTTSANFPTHNAYQSTSGGGADNAFLVKLNATGSALLYSTYLGGGDDDKAYGLALDGSGDAYLSGTAGSTNFPTTPGAFQTSGSSNHTLFVAKLNPAASGAASLVYSSYLSGTELISTFVWGVHNIAVDSLGNAYVTGQAVDSSFPTTTGAYLTTSGQGAFVTEFNAAGSGLVYSTYLNNVAARGSYGEAIAVDAAGEAYVTGYGGVPTTPGAYQPIGSGVFLTKLNSAGSALIYSSFLNTYVGLGNAVAVDGSGNAYVTGYTQSSAFPTANTNIQTTYGGANDGFAAEFNPSLSGAASLVYSTYLGGNGNDAGTGIAVDSSGNAYVTGYTGSSNFPTTPGAFQTQEPNGRYYAAFVTKIDPPAAAAPGDSQAGAALPSLTPADGVPGVATSTMTPVTPPPSGAAGIVSEGGVGVESAWLQVQTGPPFVVILTEGGVGVESAAPAWQPAPAATSDPPGTDTGSPAPFLPATWKDVRDIVFAELGSAPFRDTLLDDLAGALVA
jgi:hypothetical protein